MKRGRMKTLRVVLAVLLVAMMVPSMAFATGGQTEMVGTAVTNAAETSTNDTEGTVDQDATQTEETAEPEEADNGGSGTAPETDETVTDASTDENSAAKTEAETADQTESDAQKDAAETQNPVQKSNWSVSKSKSATELDEKFVSEVTLSLPAAEEELVSDVVFVLDKSTSAKLEEEALEMLQNLQKQVDSTKAKVKVGVVIFNKEAHTTGFMDLATQYTDIEKAIKQEISSGTNTHAGLLAGRKMLDDDTSVNASRKYMIFVSDGITYMYNAEPTATAWSFKADSVLNWAGPDNWECKYGSNDAPSDWNQWLKDIGEQVKAQGAQYEYPYGGTVGAATPVDESAKYANSIDKALYLTNQEYQNAVQSEYHCYVMNASSNADYPWATSFMNYLKNGKDVSFDGIQRDIYYLLDEGSSVKDYMGYVEGDYNFDFVSQADRLQMKVGEQELVATEITENKYGFGARADGTYDYELEYKPGNRQDEEHFVWTIHQAIKITEPVSLTYHVTLTNPKEEAGTYGTYDQYGARGYDGLYTNNEAVLYPVDSNGTLGDAEAFNKPTVSYTVEQEPTPVDPTDPGTTDPGNDPGTTNPGNDSGSDAEQVDGAAKTGDDSNMGWALLVMMLSAAGIAVCARKLWSR